MRPESTAANVTDRIDALAAALRDAGVSPDTASRLLASAATAALHAVTLDAVLAQSQAPAPSATPVAGELVRVEPAAALAA